LSNAYGISSLAPQHINQTPTAFLPLRHNTKSTTYGISSVATQHKIKRLRHFHS